ncbi:type II toxin-antitoxin system PemK/MazF family toxin [Vibrio cholerae]|uniref:type II toxin-antitoxin system PemK/MazF family toxin n=1 Tax=Vibrio cholerae TaxID=666 RepID=UPI0030169627
MLRFHPKKGTILCCDFSEGFKAPEMVKIRPVIVVTPQLPGRVDLCTIVPLSTVEPQPKLPFHHEMSPESLTEKLKQKTCWAKCDMLYTVSLERLDRISEKSASGKRTFVTGKATAEDMLAIEQCILNGLGLRKFLK